MNVPFLDLKRQYVTIQSEIQSAIQSLLESNAYVLGKAVSEFELAFAAAHGAAHCVGLSSGTAGNHTVLWALGIGRGDEVILPANTFIASAWGATLCGARPVFVDCDSDYYNIDPAKIEDMITEKTRAVVAVHLYGQAADLDAIREITDRRGVLLVEDCAQAHLAEYKGKRVGALSKASSFSFYPGKNLGAYGEAGAAMTNDPELARKFRMIRDHGCEKKYVHLMYGHNYRMEGIQGAVLGVKLRHLEKWTQSRRRAADRYRTCLKDLDVVKLPAEADHNRHVYHLFVIQAPEGMRDSLQKHLADAGIGTGLHYPVPLHLQPCFRELGYRKGDFPETERLAERGLSLPMFAEFTDEEIEYVCEQIKHFFRK